MCIIVKMYERIFILFLIALFANSCVCNNLKKDDLQGFVDAFDTFSDAKKSNKAKPTVESAVVENINVKESAKNIEDLLAVTTVKTFRVIPVREDIVEDEIVTDKPYCSGCPQYLNISSPDIINFANDSLHDVLGENNLEFVQLKEAIREVQNRILYHLTVEVEEKCNGKDEDSCRPIRKICILNIERNPWRLTKPKIIYQNCTSDNNLNRHENNIDFSDNGDSNVNLFNGLIISPEEHIDFSIVPDDLKSNSNDSKDNVTIISELNENMIPGNSSNSDNEMYTPESSTSNEELTVVVGNDVNIVVTTESLSSGTVETTYFTENRFETKNGIADETTPYSVGEATYTSITTPDELVTETTS